MRCGGGGGGKGGGRTRTPDRWGTHSRKHADDVAPAAAHDLATFAASAGGGMAFASCGCGVGNGFTRGLRRKYAMRQRARLKNLSVLDNFVQALDQWLGQDLFAQIV